jgi:hypothetical protein
MVDDHYEVKVDGVWTAAPYDKGVYASKRAAVAARAKYWRAKERRA